jgi:hypothetical protein
MVPLGDKLERKTQIIYHFALVALLLPPAQSYLI